MRPVLLLAFLALVYNVHTQPLSLVPWPAEIKQTPGNYLLKDKITAAFDLPVQDKKPLFNYFRDEMKKNYGVIVSEVSKTQRSDIRFEMQRMAGGGVPAYRLTVNEKGVLIQSNFEESAFHAIQTLFQLLPMERGKKRNIPFVEIADSPRFQYRGMHLDVCRHFFPVSFIKKYLDYLSYHKFNKFHWHLTEDQGWRIEIKKFPLLTQVGSVRNGTIIGRYPGTGNDNIAYRGFYTQEQVKEVVAYAKLRHIEVIPEIEMPGHSSAAIAAYPWLSCFPSKPTHIPPNMISRKSVEEQKNGRIKLVQETWGVFDDVFCAGKDSTFSFLQQVIDEVIPLFPSKYFHIGGDESPKTHWKQCPNCQQRIRDLKLKDEHELQSYFVQRMEKYLNSKGKILIGWDEILEGGLAPNAIVMSWRGETGGIEAARQQHQVIMTPGNPVYFDHTQSQQEDSVTIGGYNPLDKVYAYEPIPAALNENEARFVLGAQANLWTEYIKNPRKVEYMIFPRMSALSEVLWSPKQNRNWEHFQQRLPGIMERYKKWNANYSKAYYDIQSSIVASPDNKGVLLKLETRKPGDTLFIYREAWVESHPVYDQKMNVTGFNSNGMGIPWMAYNQPVQITEPGNYGVAYTSTINRTNNLPYPGFGLMVQLKFNKATGKQINLQQQASAKYPGNGAFTLVDGILNDKGLARSREFLGFEGTDCIAIIDLGAETTINQVVIHHLEQQGSWIYSPSAIDVAGSADGINFQSMGSNVVMTKAAMKDKTTLQFDAPVRTRYLRVSIFNHGVIATGNPGAGNKAWLFVDEIEVN